MSVNANITVDAIEQQIAESKGNKPNANKKTFDAKDYLDTKLKNGESSRKIKVRILPITADSNKFCVEIKTHSLKVDKQIAESGFKSFICLNDSQLPNYDENIKCPLCSKAFELFKRCKELKAEGKTELADPLYKKACSLMNKSTYIVRVVERGKEEEGVKFWRFNKNNKGEGIFDKLVALYQNKKEAYKEAGKDDNYNIFDLTNGRDIIITINRGLTENGKELPNTYLIDANDFESPLSNDPELVEKWVTDTKQWHNAYTARTADYLELIANDEIPVRNSDGQWVAKTVVADNVNKVKEEKKEAESEAQKVLEQQNVETKPSTSNINKVEDVEDDLPF